MTIQEKKNQVAKVLCNVYEIDKCPYNDNGLCEKFRKCIIASKTPEQLDYILSDNNTCIYLEACAGSGKTESLGMKAAYEICNWHNDKAGIAVLTFTNEAAKTITERVYQFYPHNLSSKHYIGTFTSFVHGYITQKFGYAFFWKNNKEKDRSFTIIDSDVKAYDNSWLSNYQIEFPMPRRKIYANQVDFHLSDNSWYFHFGFDDISLNDLYMQPDIQTLISKIRKSKNNDSLFGIDYFDKQIFACKKKFWDSGFATFEDMNMLAVSCLSNEKICKKIAQRFPLILIDECQDLSAMELLILKKIQKGGSIIHFIGDLNQSIYSFKDALPENLIKHINSCNFQTQKLSINFRSTQKIVDVSCKIQGITTPMIGSETSLFDGNDAIYFEYENEYEAIHFFEEYIKKKGITYDSAVVLTRSTNLKMKLSTNTSTDYLKHPIINAMQLWRQPKPYPKKLALRLMGYQVQKWIKTRGRADNYHCPIEFCEVYKWRLFLRNVLNDLCDNSIINKFEDITYSKWYNSVKKPVAEIIEKNIADVIGESISLCISLRTPSGTANKKIETIEFQNSNNISVETIHSVKGGSFSAVMLVSTPNHLGKTGYWENWLDDKNETTRIAYVASTRPKHLLCWALPKLNDEQRNKIENLGFVQCK